MHAKKNPCNTQAPRKQRGFTLIELSLGLIVVLAIAGIAVGLYSVVSNSQRTNDAQTQLMQISATTSKLTQGGLFTGITEHVIAQTGNIPKTMIDTTTATALKIHNPFGGYYDVAPVGTPATTATITMDKVTPGSCTDLIMNTQSNFAAVRVGTVTIKAVGAKDAAPAAVATECNKLDATPADLVFTVAT